MHSFATTDPPEGFNVSRSKDGCLIVNRRMVCPDWMKRVFFLVFGMWILGWSGAAVFISYHALVKGKIPVWLAIVWLLGGLLVLHYVFAALYRRLQSVTSYTFNEDTLDLATTSSLFTRASHKSFDRSAVCAVRQVYDGGRIDDFTMHSWALFADGPSNGKFLAREEYEVSAWLGRLIANWAGVAFIAAENRE